MKHVVMILVCTLALYMAAPVLAGQWKGVDETVVEKYAEEHGRAAQEPLINTDQGDLLLFVFLGAGVAGGFAAGYYYRVLMEDSARAGTSNDSEGKQDD